MIFYTIYTHDYAPNLWIFFLLKYYLCFLVDDLTINDTQCLFDVWANLTLPSTNVVGGAIGSVLSVENEIINKYEMWNG